MPPDYHTPRTTPFQPKIFPLDFLFVRAAGAFNFRSVPTGRLPVSFHVWRFGLIYFTDAWIADVHGGGTLALLKMLGNPSVEFFQKSQESGRKIRPPKRPI